MRLLAALVLVGGCQKVFSVSEVKAPDAALPLAVVGCGDGEREGFASTTMFPSIAACDGGWTVPGVRVPAQPAASCPAAGDDSTNPAGDGCSIGNLCAPGWHVCATAAEVAAATGSSGCGFTAGGFAGATFYATQQSGPGMIKCGSGDNDVFGCGTMGATDVDAASCAPLQYRSNDNCASFEQVLPGVWSCGTNSMAEALALFKHDARGGGALCCMN